MALLRQTILSIYSSFCSNDIPRITQLNIDNCPPDLSFGARSHLYRKVKRLFKGTTRSPGKSPHFVDSVRSEEAVRRVFLGCPRNSWTAPRLGIRFRWILNGLHAPGPICFWQKFGRRWYVAVASRPERSSSLSKFVPGPATATACSTSPLK